MTSSSALERKQRSIAILQREGVPYIDWLPIIEDENSLLIRSVEEIAWRAMALNVIAAKGEGLGQERFHQIVEQYRLENVFTPKEEEFIFNEAPSDHERLQFIWRYEAYWVLLWALKYIKDLERPDQHCNVPLAVAVMVDRSSEDFIRDSNLRTPDEILDATDLIYRYDWACVDARLKDKAAPAGLDAGVVMERHHALNWLVGYSDNAEWDDVTTDT